MKNENGLLTVYLTGSVNSGNAPEVERTISAALEGVTKVVVDCSALNYISSAGLRVLLRLRKQFPDLVVKEVSSEVYEIFDMTGFTEMMTVEKAYRVLDVAGCEVIGEGANGIVYRIDPETIVKVYRDADALEDIRRERELARTAFILGVPTAIPYDVVRVGGGYGSVFELLSAKSLAAVLRESPERIDELAAMYTDILVKLHGADPSGREIPELRPRILKRCVRLKEALPEEDAEKLTEMIKAVPCRNLIHGDYHVKNVLLQNGEALLIDMDTLSIGDPVFELGNMFAAYEGFNMVEPSRNDKFFGVDHELLIDFFRRSMRLYFDGKSADELGTITEKVMIAGYYRVLTNAIAHRDREPEFKERTIRASAEKLTELLKKQDTLIL